MKHYTVLVILLLMVVLAACRTVEQSDEPLVMETMAPISTNTEVPPTGTVTPVPATVTLTLALSGATVTPEPGQIFQVTPDVDQRMYIDPDGWFSVVFSDDLKPTDRENYFEGEDGRFLEIGYYPELGMLDSLSTACAWVGNILVENPDTSSLGRSYAYVDCKVITQTNKGDWVQIEVLQNPKVDLDHRYIYIKTKCAPSEEQKFVENYRYVWAEWMGRETDFIYELSSLTDDVFAEWAQTVPILGNVTIEEYALPAGTHPRDTGWSDAPVNFQPWSEQKETPEEAIHPTPMSMEDFGYRLESNSEGQNFPARLYFYDLLLVENVNNTEFFYFPTQGETETAIVVWTREKSGVQEVHDTFLVQNSIAIHWDDPMFGFGTRPPLFLDGYLLWQRQNMNRTRIEIVKTFPGSTEVIYSFAMQSEAALLMKAYIQNDKHWYAEFSNFVIEDGVILNEKFGLQEAFELQIVDNKPFFIFNKNGRVGIYYGGEILPLDYDDVAHYMCCGYAGGNPRVTDTSAYFFAKRDSVWYWVKVEFNP